MALVVRVEAGETATIDRLRKLTGERDDGAAVWWAATHYEGMLERLMRAEDVIERLYAFLQVMGDRETVARAGVDRETLVAAVGREFERLDRVAL